MRTRRILRLLIAATTIPCLWVGAASARYLLRTQAADRRAAEKLPLDLPLPSPSHRYLVVSPHPDDETLACAGLIQRAIRIGAEVRVIFVTSGDGYRPAAEREFRKLRMSPDDYRRFGEVRRDEARAAARMLGLQPAQLRFIGMPDGYLTDLWRRRWTNAITLPHLRSDRVPYPWAVSTGLPFSGSALIGQMQTELRAYRPTHVLLPHPSDDHGDHAAVSAFVRAALFGTKHGPSSQRPPVLLHYLVHRGDWPQPQGLRRALPLAPPAEMAGLDTDWHGLALSDREIAAKSRAVRAYRSQTAVMPRYMQSFVRATEFFGIIPDARAPVAASSLSAAPTLLGQAAPIVLDAVDDSLLRRMQAQCDIQTVMAAAARDALYLRIDTVKRPSLTATIGVFARVFDDEGRTDARPAAELTMRGGNVIGPSNVYAHADMSGVSVVLPLADVSTRHVAVLDIETSVAGVVVDRTGPRVVHLGSAD